MNSISAKAPQAEKFIDNIAPTNITRGCDTSVAAVIGVRLVRHRPHGQVISVTTALLSPSRGTRSPPGCDLSAADDIGVGGGRHQLPGPGHVALPTDAIATDQFINDGRPDSMLGEREDTIPRTALVNDEEINVAVSIVGQVAVSSDLHDSACSRGGFAPDITVGRTRILTGEVIAGDCGCSHVGAFQC
jgi:hypothetical protein